jgi:hypothetical protein
MDLVVKRELLSGLCEQMRRAGDRDDVENAVTYLAAADWGGDGAPQAMEILEAIRGRMRADKTLIEWAELQDKLFDAYSTSPGSTSLAELLAQFSAHFSVSGERVCELLASDPSLRSYAPLARAYGPYMRGDLHEQRMLAALSHVRERVEDDDAFAPLLQAWAEKVRGGSSMNLNQAAFEAMAPRWESSDDGYDGLRQVLRERLQAKPFPQDARYGLEFRDANGEVTALGLEILSAAALHPEAGSARSALGQSLAALPDTVRLHNEDVNALIHYFEADCAQAFYVRAGRLGTALIRGRASRSRTAEQAQEEWALYQPQWDEIGAAAGRAYATAILEGKGPDSATAIVIRDDVANLLGEIAATDRRLENTFSDYDLKDMKEKCGSRRVRKAFGDASVLAAAYREELHSRIRNNTYYIGGPEGLAEVDVWSLQKTLQKMLEESK